MAGAGLPALNADRHLTCEAPPYVPLSGVLCAVSVSAFLKLSALVKLGLMAVMSATLILLMEFTHQPLFADFDRHMQ